MVGIGTKIALGMAALGTAATMTGAATLAMYSATAQTQTNTFASGTVTLGSPSGTTGCTLTNGYDGLLVPGGSATCSYQVFYTGSLSAYLAFSVAAISQAENPLNGGAPNDGAMGSAALFDTSVASGQNAILSATYQDAAGDTGSGVGTAYAPVTTSSGYDTWTATVPATIATSSAGSPVIFTATGNNELTVTADVSLPLAAGNAFQGSKVGVAIQVAAVQTANNPTPAAAQFPLSPTPALP